MICACSVALQSRAGPYGDKSADRDLARTMHTVCSSGNSAVQKDLRSETVGALLHPAPGLHLQRRTLPFWRRERFAPPVALPQKGRASNSAGHGQSTQCHVSEHPSQCVSCTVGSEGISQTGQVGAPALAYQGWPTRMRPTRRVMFDLNLFI